jgi:hypothetical protein
MGGEGRGTKKGRWGHLVVRLVWIDSDVSVDRSSFPQPLSAYNKLGFTSCAGISVNKMLAKMAGEMYKPNAQTTILPVGRREGGKEGRREGGKGGRGEGGNEGGEVQP